MLDAVNGLNGFQIVVHRIANRIFSRFQRETLVPHILKGNDFSPDILLRELFSRDVLVLRVVRAVGTAVDAVIGQVQRREHDDAVAVEILFNLFGKLINLIILLLDGTGEQDGRFAVGKTFSLLGLLDNSVDEFYIFFVLVRVGEGL